MTASSSIGMLPVAWVGLVLAIAVAFAPAPRRDLPAATPVRHRGGRSWRKTFWWVFAAIAGAFDFRLGLVMAILALVRPILTSRRERKRREAAIARELPEVIELLSLALAGGGSVQGAVGAVVAVDAAGDEPRGPVSAGLGSIPVAVAAGRRFSDSLEQAGEQLGDQVKPLVRALLGSDHYGTAVGPTLQRLAHEAREARRRRAQTAARKLPVQMLWPLVLGVLPAFILLTIVPILVGTLDGLGLPPPAP